MAVSTKWSGNIKSGNQKSLRPSFSSRNLNSVKPLPAFKELIFKEFKLKLGESREDLFVSACRYAVEKRENHFVTERESRRLGIELLQKAKYCFSVNQKENAWKYLYRSLRVFPSFADSHDFIAGCYEADGKTFPAMKHFRIAKALRKFYALSQKKQVWYNNPLSYDHNIKWQFEAMEANSSKTNSRFNICFPEWLNPFRKLIAASFLWICFLLGGGADAKASESILKTKEIGAESDTLLRLLFQNRYEEGVDGDVNFSRPGETIIYSKHTTQGRVSFLRTETGIRPDFENNGFMVYPNPAISELNISIAGKGVLEFYDISGRQYFGNSIDKSNKDISLKLEGGSYIIRFLEKGKLPISKKIVISESISSIHIAESNSLASIKKSANDLTEYSIQFLPDSILEYETYSETLFFTENPIPDTSIHIDFTPKKYSINSLVGKNVTISITDIYTSSQLALIMTGADGWLRDSFETGSRSTGFWAVILYDGVNVEAESFQRQFVPGQNSSLLHANKIYQQKINATSGNGANVNITDINGNSLVNGITGEELEFKVRADEQEIIRTVNKEFFDTYKDTVIVIPGLNEKTIGLIGNYDVNTEIRNDDGNASVGIVDQYGNPLSSGENASFKQASDNIPDSKRIINAPGAQTKEIISDLHPGVNNASSVLDWIYNNQVTGKDGARVLATFNGNVVADYVADGSEELKTFVDTLLAGNLNLKQTKENYVPTNQNVAANKGSNVITLDQMLGQFDMRVNGGIAGTNYIWVANGDTLLTGVDANILYQELPQDLASAKVFLEKNGYKKDSADFADSPAGLTEKTVNQELLPNSYTLDLIITDASGDTILNGQTINVREPDGDIQSKVVSGKHTPFVVEGYFNNLEEVQFWLTANAEYDGLTGTVNQSLKLPLSSVYDLNEMKQDTMAVVLGDVENKTAYVSFMKKSERDDDTIRQLVSNDGGNTEYNHLNAQGEREKTYVIVQTSKQGTPVPQEIQDWYQEAINIHNQYVTAQGLETMKTNVETQVDYPSTLPEGTIYLLVDNSVPAPGETKLGDSPGTYNRGYTLMREGDSRSVLNTEVWGVDAGKEHDADEYIQYNRDIFGDLSELNAVGKLSFRIIQMYDGSTIQDPTP